MLSLDQYKELVKDRLAGLTDAEVSALYERDTMFADFAIKTWLALRRQRKEKDGRVDSSQL